MKTKHQFSNGYWGGWRPPRPDLSARHPRFDYAVKLGDTLLPDVFELPGIASIPCIDQGQEGSCTGHGTDGVVMYDQLKQGEPVAVMSRAMIYYDARLPEGTTGEDDGASVADAVAGVAKYGVCTDAQFPYIVGGFATAPSQENYEQAQQCAALQTMAVDITLDAYKATIASGYPIVDGMSVFSSMMTPEVAQTGVVPFPSVSDENEGGHCTWRHSFNATDEPWTTPSGLTIPPQHFGCRNSWRDPDGTWWGVGGNYFLPFAFVNEGLLSDAHVVERIGPQATAVN